MAKIIETQDGTRMLVSDDAPDDISNQWIKPQLIVSEPSMPIIDKINILLCFTTETFPIVPIQVNMFVVKKTKVKLTGNILFSDYLWLLANIGEKLSRLEIRTEDRSYIIAQGPLFIQRLLGKDINATTVDVNVSFNRDT